jgi:hypothetical protein
MRVKISHTVSLEEIPDLVEKIVLECNQTLKRDTERVRIAMHDVPKMVSTFNEVIESLDLVAVKLQDAVNIAIGWQQATDPPEVRQEEGSGEKDE